jgi:hypothetical protein
MVLTPAFLRFDGKIDGTSPTNTHHSVAAGIDIELRVDPSIPMAATAALEPGRAEPCATAVKALVIESGEQSQVFNPVVEFVFVDVVDLKSGWNGTEV